MKRLFALLLFCFFLIGHSTAQKKKFSIKKVNVPDSIKKQLIEVCETDYGIDIGDELIILNLENPSSYVYGNGIYSYKSIGPHFPKFLFIVNNGRIAVFKKAGAFDPAGVIGEYFDATKKLGLDNDKTVYYLKWIYQYLKDEHGQTYGREKSND